MLLERDFDQIRKTVVFGWLHVRIDAIDDVFFRKGGESAEKPVPDRKDIAVIRIGIRQHIVVVYLVHVWRNDNVADVFV